MASRSRRYITRKPSLLECVLYETLKLFKKADIKLNREGRLSKWFSRGGGYKNGVGGRVVELFHLGACVSMKGISPNSSKTIGEENRAMITVYITFWSVNSIWASNEYKMCSFSSVIFKSVQSKKNIIILCDAPSAASGMDSNTSSLCTASRHTTT